MQHNRADMLRRLLLAALLRPTTPSEQCPEIEMQEVRGCPQTLDMTKTVRLVLAVRSTRRAHRDAIRETWCRAAARAAAWSNASVAVRFWVGGADVMEDARVGSESELFGDLAHATRVDGADGVALAKAALKSFDLHAAAPTHWATVDDATYVYVDRFVAALGASACAHASGSAVLDRAAAVAALQRAGPTMETWLAACDDASPMFHAAHGRREMKNARRVDATSVAVTGFEPGEFPFLDQGMDVDAALTYEDDRVREWRVDENIRVEIPETCAARRLVRDRICRACAQIPDCGAVLDDIARLAWRIFGVANCTEGGAPCAAARPIQPLMTLGFDGGTTVDLWKRCVFDDEDGDGACDDQREQAVVRRDALRRVHDALVEGAEPKGTCADVRQRLRDTLEREAGTALRGVADVALLDFPAHGNRGDSAIWSGEVALLQSLNVSIREDLVCASFVPVAAAPDCDRWLADRGSAFRRAFPPSATRAIVLHGGGNVGPEYPPYEAFRKRVVEVLGDYRIVLMPQTVTYADGDEGSLGFWRAARNVTLLGRDARSFALFRDHACGGGGSCRAALAPDAAFALTFTGAPPARPEILFLTRSDGERAHAVDRSSAAAQAGSIAVRWDDLQPTEGAGDVEAFCADNGHCVLDDLQGESHLLAAHRVDAAFASFGASRAVVTDRLHGVILAILANRYVAALDVRNRKVSRFVDTWLRDAPQCVSMHTSPAAALGAALGVL